MVLEKTLESPLDCKEIQPVHSEGDQPWDFFGRNDAKAVDLFSLPHARLCVTNWGMADPQDLTDPAQAWPVPALLPSS